MRSGYARLSPVGLSLTLVLLILPRGLCSAAEPISVRVLPLEDPRLPALSSDRLKRTLDVASTMIANCYGREVRFRVAERRLYFEFVEEQEKRLKPYQRPRSEVFDIYADSLEPYRARVLNACRAYGSLDETRQLLDPAERPGVQTYQDATRALMERYARRLEALKSLKTPAGEPMMTRERWPSQAKTSWDIYMDSRGPRTELDLLLANVVLVDNDMQHPAPHGMASAFANGVAWPAAGATVVAYLPLVSTDPTLVAHRLGEMTEPQQEAAIAYVIGHEVGSHLVMQLADSYVDAAMLAKPIRLLNSKEELLAYTRWQPPEKGARPLAMETYRARMREIRIDVAIAKKDWAAVVEEFEYLRKLDIDPRWRNAIEQRIQQADWN